MSEPIAERAEACVAVGRPGASRTVAIVAMLALVAACQSMPSQLLPRELSDAVDGARVRLAPNQDLIVNLDGNLTTGFRWYMSRNGEPQLRSLGEPSYAQRSSEGRASGSGGVTTFLFKADQKGSNQIAFVYRRPWEQNIPPVRTVRFDVLVE